jgi:tripartite-type tricarboxylate transporter receptor subunit TctC
MVIQYAEGGGTDMIIRALARPLARRLGVTIRAVNQPGANGALAAQSVIARGNDGQWMMGGADYNKTHRLFGHTNNAPWVEWQFFKVGRSVPAWAVAPNSPYKSLADVVKAARDRPGTVKIANAGVGSIWHEATLVALERGSGARFVHVPYDGGAPATLAILQGEADLVASGVHEQVEYLRAGRIRNIGVFRTEPLAVHGLAEPLRPVTESVPGAAAHGIIEGVYMIAIRRDTPREMLLALQDAVREVVAEPEFADVLRNRVMFPQFLAGRRSIARPRLPRRSLPGSMPTTACPG